MTRPTDADTWRTDLTDIALAQSWPCESCGAAAGQPCKSGRGEARYPHSPRQRLARDRRMLDEKRRQAAELAARLRRLAATAPARIIDEPQDQAERPDPAALPGQGFLRFT